MYLTTGSKTMHIFAKSEALQDCEAWTRILPTAEVLQMMEDPQCKSKTHCCCAKVHFLMI